MRRGTFLTAGGCQELRNHKRDHVSDKLAVTCDLCTKNYKYCARMEQDETIFFFLNVVLNV